MALGTLVDVPRAPVSMASLEAGTGRRHDLTAEWFGIGAELGESPVWVDRDSLLASIDIKGQTLHLTHPDLGVDEVIPLRGPVNAAMPAAGPGIVLAGDQGLLAYLIDDPAIRPITHLAGGPPTGTRLSDGKVDGAGRIWIGARRPDGATGSGVLLSWEAGRPPVTRVRGLAGPNGLAWNVAGDRLFLADSRKRLIHRYRFDQTAGTVSDSEVFASWSERDGRPDGLAIDADDHLWCAAWDAGCVRRYDPRGRLAQTVVIPAIRPTSCAFGGSGLDRLWVTSAKVRDADPADRGGGLFAIDVGQRGVAPGIASGAMTAGMERGAV